MSQEYQNGDGFGYLLSFRRQGSGRWQTARVPGAHTQHFVYSNDSIRPYTPFEVKIRSYNRRGEGPESLTALVYSAEEGAPLPGPAPTSGPWGVRAEGAAHPRRSGGPLASFPALATLSPAQAGGRRRGGLSGKRSGPGGCCGNPLVAFIQGPAL